MFIVVYFVIDTIRKLLDTPSYNKATCSQFLECIMLT